MNNVKKGFFFATFAFKLSLCPVFCPFSLRFWPCKVRFWSIFNLFWSVFNPFLVRYCLLRILGLFQIHYESFCSNLYWIVARARPVVIIFFNLIICNVPH